MPLAAVGMIAGGAIGAGALGATAATAVGGIAGGAMLGASVGSMFDSSSSASKAAKGATKSADLQAEIALDQWKNYLSRYDPLAGLLAYDIAGITPTKYDKETKSYVPDEEAIQQIQQYKAQQRLRTEELVSRAGADVGMAANAARAAQERDMARQGVNPMDPRYQGFQESSRLREALAKAGAMTNARRQARQDQIRETMDLLGVGKGIPAAAGATAANAAQGYQGVANLYGQAAQGAGQLGGYLLGGGFPTMGGGASPTTTSPAVNYAPPVPAGGGLAAPGLTTTPGSLYSPSF